MYALARRIDDIGDGDGTPEEKLIGLKRVRHDIESIDPQTDDLVLVAVADAAQKYQLPMGCFGEIIDGWEGIASFVEAGLTVHWESPEATEAFTAALGDPSEI